MDQSSRTTWILIISIFLSLLALRLTRTEEPVDIPDTEEIKQDPSWASILPDAEFVLDLDIASLGQSDLPETFARHHPVITRRHVRFFQPNSLVPGLQFSDVERLILSSALQHDAGEGNELLQNSCAVFYLHEAIGDDFFAHLPSEPDDESDNEKDEDLPEQVFKQDGMFVGLTDDGKKLICAPSLDTIVSLLAQLDEASMPKLSTGFQRQLVDGKAKAADVRLVFSFSASNAGQGQELIQQLLPESVDPVINHLREGWVRMSTSTNLVFEGEVGFIRKSALKKTMNPKSSELAEFEGIHALEDTIRLERKERRLAFSCAFDPSRLLPKEEARLIAYEHELCEENLIHIEKSIRRWKRSNKGEEFTGLWSDLKDYLEHEDKFRCPSTGVTYDFDPETGLPVCAFHVPSSENGE